MFYTKITSHGTFQDIVHNIGRLTATLNCIMWTKILIFVLCITMAVSQDNALTGRYYCGRQLSRVISIVCSNINDDFDLHSIQKRSLLDECCYNRCDLADIEKYCN